MALLPPTFLMVIISDNDEIGTIGVFAIKTAAGRPPGVTP
jgi:hypothetical protein